MTQKLNCDWRCKNLDGDNTPHQSVPRKRCGNISTRTDGERVTEKLNALQLQLDTQKISWNRSEGYSKKHPEILPLSEEYYSNLNDYTFYASHFSKNNTPTLHTISSEKCLRLTSSEGDDDTINDEDGTSIIVQASKRISNERCNYCKRQSSDETPSSHVDEIQEMKLKNICGELLIELCKVTAGSRKGQQNTFDDCCSSSSDKTTAPEYGDQLKAVQTFISEEILQRRGLEYGELSPVTTPTDDKIKTITFRPLVCTKLSIPWRHRKPTSNQVRKMSVFYNTNQSQQDSSGTVSISTQVDDFLPSLRNKPPTSHDKAVCVRTRQRRYVKRIRENPKKPDVREYFRKNTINRPQKKTSHTRKHEKPTRPRNRKDMRQRNQKGQKPNVSNRLTDFFNAPSNDKRTKHFIKHFNPSTSADSKSRTESDFFVTKQRRRKNMFTLPSSSLVLLASSNRKSCSKAKKTDRMKNLEAISQELSIIDSHVKEHSRARNASMPIFNTCFKRMMSRELKTDRQKVEKSEDTKNKKEGLFSCLIPKAFSKTTDGK